MTPDEIEQLFQSRKSHTGADDELSEQETEFRTSQLKEVLLLAEKTWQEDDSANVDLIAQKLGDGCRDASWRVPIGNSGILDFCLGLLAVEGIRPTLRIQMLRIVGNSCADTDENRARVVHSGHIPLLVDLFCHPGPLMPFIGPVVYNICADYEPAQLAFCKAGLLNVLVELVLSNACVHNRGIITKILAMLALQAPELKTADPSAPAVLLKLVLEVADEDESDMEEYCNLLSAALAYLTHEMFQLSLIATGDADTLFKVFENFYNSLDAIPTGTESLETIQATFLTLLADISALPSFAQTYSLDHDLVTRLISWLTAPSTHLQTAASLCLGNVARSDETSTALLAKVAQPITAVFSITTDRPVAPGQTLYALLSFLKNLAIPAPNKPILGRILFSPRSKPVIAHIWSTTSTQPQTQFAAVSLTRLLLTNCPENISVFISPSSTADRTPAKTALQLLFETTNTADAEPTVFEGARAIVAVCKALHSPSSSSSSSSSNQVPPENESLSTFYTNHAQEIATSLSTLVSQPKFPALRSEAIFVAALMARSDDGAKVVSEALHSSPPVMDALVEIVGGKNSASGQEEDVPYEDLVVRRTEGGDMDGIPEGLRSEEEPRRVVDPGQAAGVARADRENALVLVAELLKRDESLLRDESRDVLKGLLRTGGEMVVSDRNT